MNRAELDAEATKRARLDRLHADEQRRRAAAQAARLHEQVVRPLGARIVEIERRRREEAQAAAEQTAQQSRAAAVAAYEASAARMRAHLGLDRAPLDDGEPREGTGNSAGDSAGSSPAAHDEAVAAAVARMRRTQA